MSNNPMNKDDTPPEEPQEETLQEKSARLEAEAAQMGAPDSLKDPLAPEPVDEDSAEDETEAPEDNARVEVLEAELDKTKDQMLRAVADAENARKRAQKDRQDASKFAISGFAKDLLDVADNLRRALEAVPEDLMDTEPRLKNLVDGIEATERELLRSFEKNNIKKLEPMDEPFDPNFHEVMFETPGTGKPPGTVTQVIDVGYTIHERLLRPARVGIAKDDGGTDGGPPPPTQPGGTLDTEA